MARTTGEIAGELREHADRLGSLAGKYESELFGLFDMGAEYSDCRSGRLAARFQEQRQDDTADGAVQMRIDDGVRRSGEWQRARELLVGKFRRR